MLNIKSYFFLDKEKGYETSFGKIKRDFYGIRIYREDSIFKLINLLLSLSHHKEKTLKMNFILENKDKKWNEIKELLINFRKEIKTEVVKI